LLFGIALSAIPHPRPVAPNEVEADPESIDSWQFILGNEMADVAPLQNLTELRSLSLANTSK
jgi:hypothetical protein